MSEPYRPMKNLTQDPEKNELFERLLWLRNHYDVGDPSLKAEVLRRVDETLDKFIYAKREGEP